MPEREQPAHQARASARPANPGHSTHSTHSADSTHVGLPTLPIFERLSPPPPQALLRDRIEALTRPGDIVLDLASRGGWTARLANELDRRAVLFESDPLTRLVAEIVLRPPDLRHLDAAFQAIAAAPRRGTTVKGSIDELFAATCARCGRTNPADEFLWEADRLLEKRYRCIQCRDHVKGGATQAAPGDDSDRERAASFSPDHQDAAAARNRLRDRFATPDGKRAVLPDELLDLHTPRQLTALSAILERIEGDMRAPGIESALRLAVLHAVVPSSRLAAQSGKGPMLRIAAGHVRRPTNAMWRERNPWLAFEEAYRRVRAFIQEVEAAGGGPDLPRLGTDVRSLAEGGIGAVVRLASGSSLVALAEEVKDLERLPDPPRVRLVVGSAPARANTERLSLAYLGTCWALGRQAASLLPLEPLYGPSPRVTWDAHAALIRRTLVAAAPLIAQDGRVVLFVDSAGEEGIAAIALAAVSAGYRVVGASLPSGDEPALVQLVPPGAGLPRAPRTRANVPLPPVPGGAGDPELVPTSGIFTPPERVDAKPFTEAEVGRTVTETVVGILQERGEPAPFDVILGEVLVGLDRAGHLKRLLANGVRKAAGATSATDQTTAAGPTAPGAADDQTAAADPTAALDPSVEDDPALDADHVVRLLAAIHGELERPDHPSLEQVEPGTWWLVDREDRGKAQPPLADRVEWAVFSLLTTASSLDEETFAERIESLFPVGNRADAALVRACLASYRSPGPGTTLTTHEDLVRRSAEHAEVIALLVDLGHRFGMSVAIATRERERLVRGTPLGTWLEPRERDTLPPLQVRAAPEEVAAVDCTWYVRSRRAFMFEVEWTAMLAEPVLRRHARIPPSEDLVRFLVIPEARVELVRLKLARSPILRLALRRDNWHVLTWENLGAFASRVPLRLEDLEPYLGIDPAVGRTGDQLALFEERAEEAIEP